MAHTAVSIKPKPLISNGIKPHPVEMLGELDDLRHGDQGYDGDFVIPADAVFKLAHALIVGSAHSLPGAYPLGDIYPDGSGGIRADWKSEDRHVSFVLFADPSTKNYIYVQQGDQFGGDYNVNAERLGQYLTWLNHGDIPPFGLQLHRLSRP